MCLEASRRNADAWTLDSGCQARSCSRRWVCGSGSGGPRQRRACGPVPELRRVRIWMGREEQGTVPPCPSPASHPSVDSGGGGRKRQREGRKPGGSPPGGGGTCLGPGALRLQPLPAKAVPLTLCSANVHRVDKPRREWPVPAAFPDARGALGLSAPRTFRPWSRRRCGQAVVLPAQASRPRLPQAPGGGACLSRAAPFASPLPCWTPRPRRVSLLVHDLRGGARPRLHRTGSARGCIRGADARLAQEAPVPRSPGRLAALPAALRASAREPAGARAWSRACGVASRPWFFWRRISGTLEGVAAMRTFTFSQGEVPASVSVETLSGCSRSAVTDVFADDRQTLGSEARPGQGPCWDRCGRGPGVPASSHAQEQSDFLFCAVNIKRWPRKQSAQPPAGCGLTWALISVSPL